MKRSEQGISLAIVTTLPPGRGTLNEYGYHLVRAFRQKSDVRELILLVDEIGPELAYEMEDGTVPVRVVPCWRFGDWRNAWRIARTVRQLKPDALLYNIQFASFGGDKASAALGLAAPLLTRLTGTPTAVLLHNIMETVDLASTGFARSPLMGLLTRFFGNVMTRALLAADFVALTIPRYVELISEKYGADNVLLAPHGAFESQPLPANAPEPAQPRIMTFGKFGTYKVVEPLIEAVQTLRSNGHPETELVVAGSDSPNTPGYLDGVAQKYGPLSWVTYTGYVPEADVPTLFRQSTLVAFPYTSTTGSSGVLHQAGSYGRPAVLPRIGDLAELVSEEGYVGEYFAPDDADSLAEAMGRLLDDPVLRRRQGRQNYLASCSLMIDDIADWYLLHFDRIRQQS